MKNAIITSINNRINIERKNIRSVDLVYLRKYLIEEAHYDSVDFVSKKTRKEESVSYYKDIENTNFNEYSDIYIYNSNCNFFGGVIPKETFELIKKVNNFNGNIFYVITDPKLKWVNFAYEIFKRQKENILTEDDVKIFSSKNIKAIWTGRDYSLYKTFINKTKDTILPLSHNIDLFNYEFGHIYQDVKFQDVDFSLCDYDIVYYGNNRGGYRSKKLKQYFSNNNLKKYIIGFNFGEGIDWIKYVDNKILGQFLKKAKSSIIIGDKEHNNNITTVRFFENIIYGIISFIDIEYDQEKKLYKNELLKSLLYVSNGNELEKNLKYIEENNLFMKIIELQREEVKDKWNQK